jgi:hypothetical protein
MAALAPWTCPACKRTIATSFCPQCGEEPLAPRDLSLRGLAEKGFHAFTSIDAKAARTAWRLLRHPGRLTQDWVDGIRRPYVAPFQIFLLANVIFFALQWLTGTNIFSSSLDSHLHQQDWQELAQELLARKLALEGMPLEHYAPLFDHAVVLYAKSLIVLMALPFALLLPLLYLRRTKPVMAHVVFSLHLYTFLLLLFSLALLAAKASALAGGGGLEAPRVDNVLTAIRLRHRCGSAQRGEGAAPGRVHHVHQAIGQFAHAGRRGAGFLDQRRVLLRHLVQVVAARCTSPMLADCALACVLISPIMALTRCTPATISPMACPRRAPGARRRRPCSVDTGDQALISRAALALSGARACAPRRPPPRSRGPVRPRARLPPRRSAPGCWSGRRCRR